MNTSAQTLAVLSAPLSCVQFHKADNIEVTSEGRTDERMAKGERRNWFLLVEDNEDEERLALRAFKRAEISGDVTVARDGEEAMRILEDSTTRLPSFVLLDIKLPKVSGLEVLEWMRQKPDYVTVPAIVLVGSAGAINLDQIYALGANSLVRKELEYEVYMERMVPTLKYWAQVNAVPSL